LRKISMLFMAAIFLVLCSCTKEPSEAIIQTAIAQTQSVIPTPTQIPTTDLSEVRFNRDLFDLDKYGLVDGEQTKTIPVIWPLRAVKEGNNSFSLQILNKKGEAKGWITILIYKSSEELDTAYFRIVENVGKYEVETEKNIGDRTVVYSEMFSGVLFTKCQALVHVTYYGDLGTLLDFAKDINSSIEGLVCE